MTTTMRTMLVAAALALAACGNNTTTPMDMTMHHTTPPDLMTPSCVMNPTTGNDFLNACTNAQTGDKNKDYPYFPSLAPGGKLPPLP